MSYAGKHQSHSSAVHRRRICPSESHRRDCWLEGGADDPQADYRDNEEAFQQYYDEIEICECAAGGHFKGAFQARNRSMIDRSDLAVFWVQRQNGGAWQTMRYAKKQGIPCINLIAEK